jgi:hypothetical protein
LDEEEPQGTVMQQLTEKQQKRIQRKQSERLMKKMGAAWGDRFNQIVADALTEQDTHVWIDDFGYPMAEEE